MDGGWSFYVEQTGVTISTKNYFQIYPLVVKHCKSNNVTVPSEQQVIDAMCSALRIPCFDDETHEPLINKMGLPFVRPPSGCCATIPRR
jgi:hypothetical protein